MRRNALGVTRDLPPAEMEKLMLANITVAPDELRELGERRASVAKNAPQKLGVSGKRMFIVAAADASGSGADEKRAPRVDFVLK